MERKTFTRTDESEQEAVETPEDGPDQTEPEDITFFGSGSTTLDLVLGGGWAHGRVCNVVGDRSTGKTELALEAGSEFTRAFPTGKVRLVEAESAFSKQFAAHRLAPDRYSFIDTIDVVEDLIDDLTAFLKQAGKEPSLYIVDSLDALSTEAEFNRDIHDGDVPASKARAVGLMFRRLVRKVKTVNCTLFIISQTRTNIGVTYGSKKQRTGGAALNFFGSQELWLSETGKVDRQHRSVKRSVGIEVQAMNRKNKCGKPYRSCPLVIMYDQGIDDDMSNLMFLKQAKVTAIEDVSLDEMKAHIMRLRDSGDRTVLDELHETSKLIKAETIRVWNEIEETLAPKFTKDDLRV